MQEALSLQPLQRVAIKEKRATTSYNSRTDTYNNDTNKATKDDKYAWLDADDKLSYMPDKKFIEWKVNLKDSGLTQEEKANV